MRIEQDSPAVERTGSWFPNGGAFNSGGSATLAMDQGSALTLTFTGSAVKWIGFRDSWSGIAEVYLDGVLQATIDTFSEYTQAAAVLYTASGLNSGTHKLTIVATGRKAATAGGAWVWVDAFDVLPVAKSNATAAVDAANSARQATRESVSARSRI